MVAVIVEFPPHDSASPTAVIVSTPYTPPAVLNAILSPFETETFVEGEAKAAATEEASNAVTFANLVAFKGVQFVNNELTVDTAELAAVAGE